VFFPIYIDNTDKGGCGGDDGVGGDGSSSSSSIIQGFGGET